MAIMFSIARRLSAMMPPLTISPFSIGSWPETCSQPLASTARAKGRGWPPAPVPPVPYRFIVTICLYPDVQYIGHMSILTDFLYSYMRIEMSRWKHVHRRYQSRRGRQTAGRHGRHPQ